MFVQISCIDGPTRTESSQSILTSQSTHLLEFVCCRCWQRDNEKPDHSPRLISDELCHWPMPVLCCRYAKQMTTAFVVTDGHRFVHLHIDCIGNIPGAVNGNVRHIGRSWQVFEERLDNEKVLWCPSLDIRYSLLHRTHSLFSRRHFHRLLPLSDRSEDKCFDRVTTREQNDFDEYLDRQEHIRNLRRWVLYESEWVESALYPSCYWARGKDPQGSIELTSMFDRNLSTELEFHWLCRWNSTTSYNVHGCNHQDDSAGRHRSLSIGHS